MQGQQGCEGGEGVPWCPESPVLKGGWSLGQGRAVGEARGVDVASLGLGGSRGADEGGEEEGTGQALRAQKATPGPPAPVTQGHLQRRAGGFRKPPGCSVGWGGRSSGEATCETQARGSRDTGVVRMDGLQSQVGRRREPVGPWPGTKGTLPFSGDTRALWSFYHFYCCITVV